MVLPVNRGTRPQDPQGHGSHTEQPRKVRITLSRLNQVGQIVSAAVYATASSVVGLLVMGAAPWLCGTPPTSLVP